MKALVNTAPGRLELLEVPMPIPGPGQIRIRTHACGICATDLKMVAGWERTGYPSIPGHEWSGMIHAVGGDFDPALVGEACVAENVLSDGGEVGFEHPGGYGEYFITSGSNLYILPGGFPLSTAILAEPLAVVLRAIRRVNLKGIERALIFGDGPVGLLTLMLLRNFHDLEVYLVGGISERLEAARELGATGTYSYRLSSGAFADDVASYFRADFPLVIDASGSAAALNAALLLARRVGQVLVIGDYDHARADFEWNFFLHRELSLTGSNAGAGAWADAVQLLTESQLPLGQLVTHQFPIDQFQTALRMVENHEQGVIKAALIW